MRHSGLRLKTEIITFTTKELKQIESNAKIRTRSHRLTGVATKKVNGQSSDLEIDYNGAFGEYAVAKFLGLPWEEKIYYYGDAGYDFKLENGWTIDVKTTLSSHRNLLFRRAGKFKASVAVLVWPLNEKQAEIVGWILRDYFLLAAQPRDLGYGINLVLEYNKLWPIQGLREIRGK